MFDTQGRTYRELCSPVTTISFARILGHSNVHLTRLWLNLEDDQSDASGYTTLSWLPEGHPHPYSIACDSPNGTRVRSSGRRTDPSSAQPSVIYSRYMIPKLRPGCTLVILTRLGALQVFRLDRTHSHHGLEEEVIAKGQILSECEPARRQLKDRDTDRYSFPFRDLIEEVKRCSTSQRGVST